MEKFSQYRDKGTGIAPFFPIPSTPSGIYLPLHVFLFIVRVPILLTVLLAYILTVSWLPIASFARKAVLWTVLGVPGIWWVDLRIDGLKRGSLGKETISTHVPQPSSVIVSCYTSPIDIIYLAAVFDPIFTRSYHDSRHIRRTSLLGCLISTFQTPAMTPPSAVPSAKPEGNRSAPSGVTTLTALLQKHPYRTICILPETTTTNGRAILPLSPSILTVPRGIKMFPVSLRYAPQDVTTPMPGWKEALRFLWNLCSRPTHTIRVRIAEPIVVEAVENSEQSKPENSSTVQALSGSDIRDETREPVRREERSISATEKKLLERVAESLARLSRVKRVNIGVYEKIEFIKYWNNGRK